VRILKGLQVYIIRAAGWKPQTGGCKKECKVASDLPKGWRAGPPNPRRPGEWLAVSWKNDRRKRSLMQRPLGFARGRRGERRGVAETNCPAPSGKQAGNRKSQHRVAWNGVTVKGIIFMVPFERTIIKHTESMI